MRKLLGVQGKYGWANAGEVKQMLGLSPEAHLPSNGVPPKVIQGIEVYVRALAIPTFPGRQLKFALRVMGVCPVCQKHLALSRLPQHSKVHTLEEINSLHDSGSNFNG